MSQKLNLSLKGLSTSSNQLSTPEGSFTIAKNVSIDKGVAESRRGFQRIDGSFSNTDDRADVLTEYQTYLIAHRSNDDKLSYFDGANWNDYAGTFSHPDSNYARMKFLKSNSNLLFTTSSGIKVLDAYNATVYSAGMPKGLDGEGSVSGTSGFLGNDSQVAYRVVWGARDANNNLFLGSPSQRIIVANAVVEVSSITCDTKANTTESGYIDINTGNDTYQYRFWMDTTGSSPAPVDGGRTLVRVNISGDTTASDVASTLQASIDSQTGLTASVLSDVITVTNDDPGETTDILTDLVNAWSVSVTTSASTRDVSLTFTIPTGITTSDFYQVYRSKESSSYTDEPNDELQLVYEGNPTSGEITAKSITITDSTPVSLMGAYLYSNESQEGVAESNDEPPFAKDLAEFKGFTFYGNIKRKHYLNIKLLAVGGSSGLAVDDTITINGDVYTAKSSETVASAQFKVYTSGSASQNIDDTARSLVKVINQYSGNTDLYAYYESGYNDLPGQILLRQITLSDTSFSVSVSRSSAWDIDDGTSDNEEYISGIAYSKNQQPEHVPLSHLEFAGSKSYPIRRILSLRDSLFILKDDGVYKLTGSGGQWSIEALDTSTKILAPESAVVVNNQIICLSDQGVVGISDVGVQVYSEAIKDQLLELIGNNFSNLKKYSFGIGYETDHKYHLFCVDNEGETTPTRALTLNTFTNQWTEEIVKSAAFGFINPEDDKMYLANTEDKHVLKERKSYTFRDFVDEELDGFEVVSSIDYEVVMNTIRGLTVGDLLYEDSSTYSPIESIDAATNTITVRDNKTWSTGSVNILKGIDCELEWTNVHGENPGVEKHFADITLLFKESRFSNASLSFYTDVSGGYSSVTITGTYGGGGWGAFPWGSLPWGGTIRPKPKRVSVPRNKNRGTLLSVKFNHRVAYGVWKIQGISLNMDYVSERLESDTN